MGLDKNNNVDNYSVELNMYNKCEHFYDCAVEVLTNSLTGEQSVGWVYMDSSIAEQWKAEDEMADYKN